jgi:hypothetical protein
MMRLVVFLALMLSGCTFAVIPPAPGRAVGAGAEPEAGEVFVPAPTARAVVDLAPAAVIDVRCVDAILLNVREGAGVEHRAVGYLEAGDLVRVFEVRDGWARLASGWVRESYLVGCKDE